jgi:hypothetical protein
LETATLFDCKASALLADEWRPECEVVEIRGGVDVTPRYVSIRYFGEDAVKLPKRRVRGKIAP